MRRLLPLERKAIPPSDVSYAQPVHVYAHPGGPCTVVGLIVGEEAERFEILDIFVNGQGCLNASDKTRAAGAVPAGLFSSSSWLRPELDIKLDKGDTVLVKVRSNHISTRYFVAAFEVLTEGS